MMRMVAVVLLVGGALTVAAPGWSGEIYNWTDKGGTVHYSNTPTSGAASVSVTDSDSAPSPTPPAPGEVAAPENAEDAATFSTQVSLQRRAIERGMRDVERRLANVDARLVAQARARTELAGGSVATGGIGTNAAGAMSPEEHALDSERRDLADRQAALQSDYAKLRTEVAARFGTTPAWWVEYRPGRR